MSRTDSATFADLRADGNGVAALRTTISVGFTGQRASDALKTVADQAQLNITFDPQLPELRTTLTIGAHARSAATALLEIARESRLRVRVSREGQVVVAALPVVAPQASARDTTPPVTLPAVRTSAERVERQEFEFKTGVGKVSITGREARSAPVFVEPDVLRTVQMLPGIAARSDYSAGFNVRGGEADQNLVLIDGYPIFNPFHIGGVVQHVHRSGGRPSERVHRRAAGAVRRTALERALRGVGQCDDERAARHGGGVARVVERIARPHVPRRSKDPG